MTPQAFKKFPGDDLDKIQDNIGIKFQQFDIIPFSKGVMLTLALTTTATAYDHTLGQTPAGFIVIDKDANVDIWRSGAATATKITLDASGTVNAKIWVF